MKMKASKHRKLNNKAKVLNYRDLFHFFEVNGLKSFKEMGNMLGAGKQSVSIAYDYYVASQGEKENTTK